MHLPPIVAMEILNSGTDAIIVVDPQGEIVYASTRAMALLGYSAEELAGEPVEMLIPHGLRARHEHSRHQYGFARHARPLVSGSTFKALRKDGRVIDTEIALTPLETEEGVFVQAVLREVDSVDRPDTFFRHLLDAAPDAMIIVDQQGKIAIINAQTEEIFGYEREELLGKDVEMLMPERFRGRHEEHRAGYMGSPRLREMGAGMELLGLRSDGIEFPVEISLSPIHAASGQFVCSVIRDVTERHKMQQALIAARQEAERANKANSTFLAAASHDLRQPVQALNLLAGALRRSIKSGPALEMIKSQQESLDAMTNLLNSLLDISRLEAGAIEPELEDFSVKRVIGHRLAEFTRQAQHKGLRFSTESCDAVIRSDPNLLGEIIQNFVVNAIRYTNDGSVQLTCTECDGKLRISVTDTGVGIEADQLDNIFREFHQIRLARRRREGFGLGLAIARRLADLLGHEISVESTPGHGSCFSICVPTVNSTETASNSDSNTSKASAISQGLVLLVEDDAAVADAWSLMLRGEGYRVALAASADEARAVLRELTERPQLIISDYHLLENSNGVDAVAAIRSDSNCCIPAFILTGDTSKIVQEAEKLENCLVMSKPVSADNLLLLASAAVTAGSVPVR
ncbi:MAG: PAS domain S-box protein [Woeseia sp.]